MTWRLTAATEPEPQDDQDVDLETRSFPRSTRFWEPVRPADSRKRPVNRHLTLQDRTGGIQPLAGPAGISRLPPPVFSDV
jgi:hypothetical protein